MSASRARRRPAIASANRGTTTSGTTRLSHRSGKDPAKVRADARPTATAYPSHQRPATSDNRTRNQVGEELVLDVSGVERAARTAGRTPDRERAKDERDERDDRCARTQVRALNEQPQGGGGADGLSEGGTRTRVEHPAQHRGHEDDEEGEQTGDEADEHVTSGVGQPRRRGRALAVRVVGRAPTSQHLHDSHCVPVSPEHAASLRCTRRCNL